MQSISLASTRSGWRSALFGVLGVGALLAPGTADGQQLSASAKTGTNWEEIKTLKISPADLAKASKTPIPGPFCEVLVNAIGQVLSTHGTTAEDLSPTMMASISRITNYKDDEHDPDCGGSHNIKPENRIFFHVTARDRRAANYIIGAANAIASIKGLIPGGAKEAIRDDGYYTRMYGIRLNPIPTLVPGPVGSLKGPSTVAAAKPGG